MQLTITVMNLPRLRIAQQLSVLLAAVAILAVLLVGGFTVWNLRSGFVDYLRIRDQDQLNRFTKLVEEHAALDPSMSWLRGNREAMRGLMDAFHGRPQRADNPADPINTPPQGAIDDELFELLSPPQNHPRQTRPPIPAPAGPPGSVTGSIANRTVIFDMQGQRLAGRILPSHIARLSQAVMVNGQAVAMIELAQETTPIGVDARFLQRQYLALALAALGTLCLSIVLAVWVAKRWSRPLRALQHTTHHIAMGQHTAPLQPDGAYEIAQLMQDVNTMTVALARLEGERRLWIAHISHELRTPLAVLRGEFEAIEDGVRQLSPALITSLYEEVMQLVRLVNDLHTLAVADLEGIPCDFAQGDAHALLTRVGQKMQAAASAAGLQLTLPTNLHQAVPVYWDMGRMEQLLTNILSNSVRYTDTPGHIQVQCQFNPTQLTFTVCDSAPSVSAADLPKLFDPLFRTDKSRQRHANGHLHSTGLGLSIVQTIAKAHGGSANASVSPLGGLCITVQLPRQAPQHMHPV